MQLTDIPADSLLVHWTSYLAPTEIPLSYQIASGLSTIGVCLKRNRWFDQLDWRVFPNQSVMFIGPSGCGKDTIINRSQKVVESLTPLTGVRAITGVTLESIYARLADLPAPATAFVSAPEATAFFGKADYQANMLSGITDLLSNKDKADVTTKGSYKKTGMETFIMQPTLTMHTGSTVEWLHKAMPEGTLEGGFLGRFLIVVEESLSGKFVPLVKRAKTRQQLMDLGMHLDEWNRGLGRITAGSQRPREMIMLDEAEDWYTNWYYNRFKQFSKAVMPYANRSRDMVLRLGMLMAASREHLTWIEETDMVFAGKIIADVAGKIDRIVLPQTPELQIANQMLDMMPCSYGEIVKALSGKYRPYMIADAREMLKKAGQYTMGADKILRRKDLE